MNIKLHNQETWPDDIKDFIHLNKQRIRGYVEISKKCKPCFDSKSFYYPDKTTQTQFKSISEEFCRVSEDLRALLNPHRLEMIHCTKLLTHEIDNIKITGLKTLTSELVEWRINSAFEYGYLNAGDRDFLLSDYQKKLNDEHYKTRQNQLWFVTQQHLSSDHCSVERSFTSWGGESVYNEHDYRETFITNKLKTIGIPCIIKTSVLISDLKLSCIENAMLFTAKIADDLEYFPEFDDTHGDVEGFVEKGISGEYIEEIIELNNPKFGEIYNKQLLEMLIEKLGIIIKQ